MTVNASVRPPIVTSCRRGIVTGPQARNSPTPHQADSSPSAPPMEASNMLSLRSCRIMRDRPAPSAARRAISLPRPAERASCRLATLAHAISNTQPTAQSNTHIALYGVPRMTSRTEVKVTLQPLLNVGYCCSNRRAMMFSSASACPGVAFGLRRATARRSWPPRSTSPVSSMSGIQTSVRRGNCTSGGATPTTVKLFAS